MANNNLSDVLGDMEAMFEQIDAWISEFVKEENTIPEDVISTDNPEVTR